MLLLAEKWYYHAPLHSERHDIRGHLLEVLQKYLGWYARWQQYYCTEHKPTYENKIFFGKDEYLFRYLCNSFIGITNLKFISNFVYKLNVNNQNGTQQILLIMVYISLVWFSTKFWEITLNLKPTRCSSIVKKYLISVNFLLQGMYFESCQQWQVFLHYLGHHLTQSLFDRTVPSNKYKTPTYKTMWNRILIYVSLLLLKYQQIF